MKLLSKSSFDQTLPRAPIHSMSYINRRRLVYHDVDCRSSAMINSEQIQGFPQIIGISEQKEFLRHSPFHAPTSEIRSFATGAL